MAGKVELSDKELSNVNGGYTFSVTSLEGGDVFLCRDCPTTAFVIATDMTIESNDTEVSFYDTSKSENGWRRGPICTKPLSWILRIADFSRELTGKI